jgi:plasmid maintenance system antidote protein VapI
MRMKNPPHPGLSVRYDCLEPLGLSVADGAEALGVTRQAMSNLVRGPGRDICGNGGPSGKSLRRRR